MSFNRLVKNEGQVVDVYPYYYRGLGIPLTVWMRYRESFHRLYIHGLLELIIIIGIILTKIIYNSSEGQSFEEHGGVLLIIY